MGLFHRAEYNTKKAIKNGAKNVKEIVKPSKTRSQVQAEIMTELDLLEEEFKLQIERQFQILNERGLTAGGRESAESTIELCLGGLNLVKLAREDLRKISTNAVLASSMKSLGHTMKTMNRMAGMTPEIKTKYLQKQVEKMNDRVGESRQQPSEIKETMNKVSMEGMDKKWTDNVQAVINHSMSVDDFVINCGDIKSDYETIYRYGRMEDDDDFYSKMRKLEDAGFDSMLGDVDSCAENIEKSAEDLAGFQADIDSIF